MITRFLSSATLGLAVATALMYLMHSLIEIGPGIELDETPRPILILGRMVDDTDVVPDEKEFERIDDPAPQPPSPPRDEFNGDAVTPVRLTQLPPVFTPDKPDRGMAQSDGPLVNVIRVKPTYPAIATQRGLEGYVVVRFDVTALGTVENVTIVESSNRVFERAAKAATLRFRYKARVVDGAAQSTRGLMYRFVFEFKQ